MARNQPKEIIGICLECDSPIPFSEPPHLGQLVTCPQCQSTLEVVRKFPLELDWPLSDEEDEPLDELEMESDWDDDDDSAH